MIDMARKGATRHCGPADRWPYHPPECRNRGREVAIKRPPDNLASPSVLAMLLTTKYADDTPLYRFEKMLSRHSVDIPRQTLARRVIQCGETCLLPAKYTKPSTKAVGTIE